MTLRLPPPIDIRQKIGCLACTFFFSGLVVSNAYWNEREASGSWTPSESAQFFWAHYARIP